MGSDVTPRVTLAFQLSDYTLGRVSVPVTAVRVGAMSGIAPSTDPQPPATEPDVGSWGWMQREVPITEELPPLKRVGHYLRYAVHQYRHCYIDMRSNFDAYRQKFSSKTRSTLTRKVKKFTEQCGGELRWTSHRTPAEIEAFLPQALSLSARTYQERLLDAGLPSSAEFRERILAEAAADRVRAYLLFHGDKPVSYLFCPVENDILIYAYLGYDPDYKNSSVGTVLQWLALEQLFAEERFRYFDFTEGESDHKRLFATHEQRCANILFVRDTIRSRLLLYGHRLFVRGAERVGELLERWGLKRAIRRLIRFGASTQSAS